jgi:hypothetical protein
VRVVIDFDQGPPDSVEGVLDLDGQEPIRFSGWLELLRLLEQAGRTAGEGARR